MKIILSVDGMHCAHCEAAVSSELSKLSFVSKVKADASSSTVTLTTDGDADNAQIKAAVENAGFTLREGETKIKKGWLK